MEESKARNKDGTLTDSSVIKNILTKNTKIKILALYTLYKIKSSKKY